MKKFICPVLLTALATTLSGPAVSAQEEDGPRKHSIIRVITMAGGSDGTDSEAEVRVLDVGDMVGTGSASTWVTALPLKRGYLGVQLLDLTPELQVHFGVPEGSGVLISEIVEDSPAEVAGLQVGDVLTAIDGDPVGSSSEIARRIAAYEDGQSVLLEVWRNRTARTLTAAIAERERTVLDLGRLMLHSGGGLGTTPKLSRIFVRGEDGEELLTGGLGPITERIIEIDEAGLHEVLRDFEQRFESPDFVHKFRMLGRDREDLQLRIEELEQRLKALEKQIDKLP